MHKDECSRRKRCMFNWRSRSIYTRMPLDSRNFEPGRSENVSISRNRDLWLIPAWLFLVAAMIFVMIVLGGATRLTGSGLSIMEWAPFAGVLPPTSHREWERLFALYQQIPQYKLLNAGFGIEGFRQIFWLEWVHRLWGRLTGAAVFLPLMWLWATGRLRPALRVRLLVVFCLGALQGAVGWFMVSSGFLSDTTAVSAYRLVIHLMLAVLLYGTILWTALNSLGPPTVTRSMSARAPTARRLAIVCCCMVVLTLCAGGFVAGLHAGLDYNTFPLMDGALVPPGYARLHPFVLNLTENVAAVQFDHRLLATLTAFVALATAASILFTGPSRRSRLWAIALAGMVLIQFALGILTLLYVVPIPLGVAHQAGAILLLTAALGSLHETVVVAAPEIPSSAAS